MLNLLVVIINYKTPELTSQAVLTVIPQLGENDKICLVDNLSDDNSIEYLTQFIEHNDFQTKVNLIASPINGGFSAGNNIGIKSEEAKYYLLLNSDAYLKEQAIEKLIGKVQQSSLIGIVAPQLIWEGGKQQTSCFYYLTPVNSFLNSVNTGFISRLFSLFGINEVAIPLAKHKESKPEWLSFACILLRGSLIQDIGLMDEGYFMYYEDMDYCHRANIAGWKLAYMHEAKVVHLNQGASNQEVIKRLPEYYFKSRSRYFLKFYGHIGLLLANLIWSFGRLISVFREIIEMKPSLFHKAMFFDIWKGFFTSRHGNKNDK